MKKSFTGLTVFLLVAILCAVQSIFAQSGTMTSDGKQIQFLWPSRKSPFPIPLPVGLTDTTYSATDTLKNSWLVAYPAASNPSGTAIITMPGGGYLNLAGWVREGTQVAAKFTGSNYGITVFILHYRDGVSSGNGPFMHPCEMWDAQRAVRWVRAHAAQYGINPNRIGVMGFSSGGHMATTVATHNDIGNVDSTSINWYPGTRDTIEKYSCKPNFQVLGYPMTTMLPSFAYSAGRTALLGASHSAALDTLMSNEKQITSATSPAFLVYGTSDGTVNPKNSTAYIDSLTAKGITYKSLPIVTSVHGFGLADSAAGSTGSTYKIPAAAVWPDSMMVFLARIGITTPGGDAIQPARTGKIPTLPAYLNNTGSLDALGRFSEHPIGPALNAVPVREPSH